LRQLGLAALNYTDTQQRLVGPSFSVPVGNSFDVDRGLFVHLLPYLDSPAWFEQFSPQKTTFHRDQAAAVAQSPRFLQCPSAQGAAQLNRIAARLSGPAVDELSSVTSDYVANGGVYDISSPSGNRSFVGSSPIYVENMTVPRVRLEEIQDGLSNTFWFWETSGGLILPFRSRVGRSPDLIAGSSFFYLLNLNPVQTLESRGVPSTKSYYYSWAGIRLGGIRAFDANGDYLGALTSDKRSLSLANDLLDPYSFHLAGVNFAMCDGSTRTFSDSTSATIIFALGTRRNGEIAVPE
jgi:hypothetical protein